MDSGKRSIGNRLRDLISQLQEIADECGYDEEGEEVESEEVQAEPVASKPKADKVSLATSLFQRSK